MNDTDLVGELIARDRAVKKKIAVVGDSMLDVWSHGELTFAQEHCPKFRETARVLTPGGAANAARQLRHWNAVVRLVSAVPMDYAPDLEVSLCLQGADIPVKRRYLGPDGRTVFRVDEDDELADNIREICRQSALNAIKTCAFNAVLISDYAKGFLDDATIREIVTFCVDNGVPVVADPKRDLRPFFGATIKKNHHFEHDPISALCPFNGVVTTYGAHWPNVEIKHVRMGHPRRLPAVPEVNHVGAGDCFAAHLTLAIAHGFTLPEAATVAHSAGRVFVQHPYARPPWPHEIRRDLYGQWGKVIRPGGLEGIRKSTSGRIVFTNGVFRLPHAGHTWLLNWARRQGDLLIVAINDDGSARVNKGPENFVLPLKERLEWLTSLDCVDWIVPFPTPDPTPHMEVLKPDILVKGHEFEGRRIPGDELVPEVRIAPPNAYPRHSTDLVAAIRG